MKPSAATIDEQTRHQKRDGTIVLEQNENATKPVVANIGGADSSKSYSLAQLFIGMFTSLTDKSFLICRKTLPALKLTAYKLVVDLLKHYGFYRRLKHNKSEHTIANVALNNLLVFASIDDPEKFKSTEFNYVWMEEANEFTWEDYIILKLRLRAKTRPGQPNRMYLSFNPSEEQGWINQRLFKEPDVQKIHSTYRDNPFAAEADIAVLEGLREQDEAYWLIYAKGEFARVRGTIHRLTLASEFPECPETIYGLDFGFVHPNALVQVDIDMEHRVLYLTEMLYETGMTNADLKERLKELIPEKDRNREIYADSAEPARIEEIYQEGFNIFPADKSVADGIDCVNRFRLVSKEENVNLNREMNSYKRKTDKHGNVLEEPVKFRDHCPNALRYAAYSHLRDRLVATEPGWTYHVGMKEPAPAEKKATSAVVGDERESAKGKAKARPQGKAPGPAPKPVGRLRDDANAAPAPKRDDDDEGSWVI